VYHGNVNSAQCFNYRSQNSFQVHRNPITKQRVTMAELSDKQKELLARIDRSRTKKRVAPTLATIDTSLPKLPSDRHPHRAAFDAAFHRATDGQQMAPEQDPTNPNYMDILPNN
jgi:hypothetical protein